jgi:hypothetical protein
MSGMGNLLEQEAELLKRKYGPQYHKLIEYNFACVIRQMPAGQCGVDVNEGLLALSYGLPPSPRSSPRMGRRQRPRKIGRKRD